MRRTAWRAPCSKAAGAPKTSSSNQYYKYYNFVEICKCFSNQPGCQQIAPRCRSTLQPEQGTADLAAAACISLLMRTWAFSSARTTTAARELLLRNTGVKPAMLPRLERLLETRADAEGTMMALDIAATCMAARIPSVCTSSMR